MKLSCVLAAIAALQLASAQTIAQINGNKYISPLNGTTVSGVSGLVTAKSKTGFWMRSTTPDDDPATSESIFVFGSSTVNQVNVGDIITLGGTVSEYRSDPSYLYLQEISRAINIQVQSSNNTVTPVVLGTMSSGIIGNKNLNPPTVQYTSLDNGNVFATPNNQSQISKVNPTLDPSTYGMDFWQSLLGEYVTVSSPVSLGQPNQYGDTWVRGNWTVTGLNGRGGLTITALDANPEAIVIVDPLDGTTNPQSTKLGDNLADITGVIYQAFGSYVIMPETAVSVISSQTPALPPKSNLTQATGKKPCSGITMTDYNVDNLAPNDTNLPRLGNQIVQFLNSPTLIFLQEAQDNDGATDDGVVNANQTFQALINAISAAGGPTYAFTQIDPLNDSTGGEPGGNIRNGYLYNPKVLKLAPGTPGTATQATVVQKGPKLSHNPGLIAPNNPAFNDSRRPIVAQWQTVKGDFTFFTVNNHDTSKGGSSSLFGDYRPPVNLGVTQREAETTVTANFIRQILAKDSTASVVAAGDWNEFAYVLPQKSFVRQSGLMDLDIVAGTTPVERYTYLFNQNSQALIHFYVSNQVAKNKAIFQRIHVNTWSTYANEVSDHDPDVVKINVCT